MQVTLRPEDERFIQARLKTGRYDSAEAVVHDALALLRLTPRSLEEMKGMVQVGLDQLERGEGMPLDMAKIKAEGRRRLAQMKKAEGVGDATN